MADRCSNVNVPCNFPKTPQTGNIEYPVDRVLFSHHPSGTALSLYGEFRCQLQYWDIFFYFNRDSHYLQHGYIYLTNLQVTVIQLLINYSSDNYLQQLCNHFVIHYSTYNMMQFA